MRPAGFDLATPERLDEAVALLRATPGARALAGGQSLMPALALRESRTPLLVDVGRLRELRGIDLRDDGTVLRIGAGEPMWDVEHDETVGVHAPLLVRTLGTVGAVAIRHRATLGGSAAWSDPTSQLPATLLALDAVLETSAARHRVEDDFFRASQDTALGGDELIVAVELPSWRGAGIGLRHVRRTSITWPVAGCAAVVRMREGVVAQARVALYGCGVAPLLARDAATLLEGREPDDDALAEAAAAALAGADPLDDVRASAGYRREVLPVLVRRALQAAVDDTR